MVLASDESASAALYLGTQPSCSLALPVSITTEVRPACSHSSAEGTNGNRDITSDVATAAIRGTRTGRAPSASATSDIDSTPSPAMLYAPGGADVVTASAIAAATSS